MRKLSLAPALAVALSLFAACDRDPTALFACTTELRPNVVVEVRDSITGAGAATGAVGTLQVSNRTVELHANATGTHMHESDIVQQPGTYTVTIAKPGYQTKVIDDVVVEVGGVCRKVITENVLARLSPIS